MNFVDEFRDGELARGISAAIAREADPARSYRFLEFCGGHTHALSRYGLTDLLPAQLHTIHGLRQREEFLFADQIVQLQRGGSRHGETIAHPAPHGNRPSPQS